MEHAVSKIAEISTLSIFAKTETQSRNYCMTLVLAFGIDGIAIAIKIKT
jgi:hypothetical protein